MAPVSIVARARGAVGIIKAEHNYVLNPAHLQARKLKIARTLEDFVFDARLLKR